MKKIIFAAMFITALLYGQSEDPFANQREVRINYFLNYYKLESPAEKAYQIMPCVI